jgi:hypothetical protein
MKRRNFLGASAAAGLAAAAESQAAKPACFHLLYYYMRNGTQLERTTKYLGDTFLPAARRAGAGTAGFFSAVIAPASPFILSLVSYPSLAALETVQEKLAADAPFQKGWDAYNTIGDPPYQRMEGTLLRAFPGMPSIVAPPADRQRAARIFELRTYESTDEKASNRKRKMFEDGEAAIFRRLGMNPVFFGQATLLGRNLPNITYMLAFDDLAAREKLWKDFGADAEWRKLRAQPGLSDAEIVSNISNAILRPLAFSEIR